VEARAAEQVAARVVALVAEQGVVRAAERVVAELGVEPEVALVAVGVALALAELGAARARSRRH
jgi:hypothetical protein